MNKKGFIVWLPFTMGVILTLFVGIILYDIGFYDKFGMRPLAIVLSITCFVGTFLGFSMQRMYEDFQD